MGIREWIFPSRELNDLSELLPEIIKSREIEEKKIEDFLFPDKVHSNPFDFADMDKLVKRVKKAIKSQEKICIYGDYDVDGITATALMYLYLKDKKANVMCFIPDREKNGYGMSTKSVDDLKKQGVNLIFTVDNGISSKEEVEYASSVGIDTIVTDHHRPPESLPKAVAVVDPHRDDCKSKFKNFSGVGVAFKSIEAIEKDEGNDIDKLLSEYSDLVAIGTIGDSIKLFDESRRMVKLGVENISSGSRPGIKTILKNSNLYGKNLTATDIAFSVAPKINAAGRIASPNLSLNLLLTESEEEAEKIYSEIFACNEKRREIEREITLQVNDYIESNLKQKFSPVIIACGRGWHTGVIGISASKITEKYGKPSILITYDDENARGSCRSLEGFCIHTAISSCSKNLDRFGGHPMAAGINLKTENIKKFEEEIINYCLSLGDMPNPKLKLDIKLNPALISIEMLLEIQKLQPFGKGNPEPVFYISDLILQGMIPIGGGKHLKLRFRQKSFFIEVICFNISKEDFLYSIGDRLDLAVTLSMNEYRNRCSVSLYLVDAKLSELDTPQVLDQKKKYEKFKLGRLDKEIVNSVYFSRDDFALVYKYLRGNRFSNHRVDVINYKIGWKEYNIFKLYIIIDALQQLKLINVSWNADEFRVTINKIAEKIDLKSSDIISQHFKWRD